MTAPPGKQAKGEINNGVRGHALSVGGGEGGGKEKGPTTPASAIAWIFCPPISGGYESRVLGSPLFNNNSSPLGDGDHECQVQAWRRTAGRSHGDERPANRPLSAAAIDPAPHVDGTTMAV